MSDSTGGGGFERITMRVLMALGVAGFGWLQTGQISIQGIETSRDTDAVAILKVVHNVEMRLQRLELQFHPEVALSPIAEPAPAPDLPDEAINIRKALNAIRSKVSPEEVETYQQAR
jgi:hypothetical protein